MFWKAFLFGMASNRWVGGSALGLTRVKITARSILYEMQESV